MFFFFYKIYILIFYSLLQIYNLYCIQPETTSDEISSNITEENTVIARLFKKRHVEHEDKLQLYLSLPNLDGQIKPLQWWKMHELQYPRLARMARDYLAISATSVPSEECFSTSKNLITSNRNRLSGKTARACMCLKSWWANFLPDSDN